MQKLACPRNGVSGLTFSPDGDMLAGVGAEALYCWTRSRGWEQTGLRHRGASCVTFHPSGLALAYCGLVEGTPRPDAAREIRLYPLTAECRFEPDVLQADPLPGAPTAASPAARWVQKVAFTLDGRTLLANRVEYPGLFSRVRGALLHWHFAESGGVWRAADPAPAHTVTRNGAAVTGDSCPLLAGTWGVAVCPLDAAVTAPLQVPDVWRCAAVAVAPRGELVAAAEATRIRVWSLRRPEALAAWPLPPPPGLALAFAPDGRTLAAGYAGRTVALLDPSTGACRAEYDFGVGPVHSLAYAPDGMTLAVAGRGGLVVVDAE